MFYLCFLIGFILFIIPGIYLALTYWTYMYFIIDRNCGIMESFQLASQHASGNRINTLLLWLISAGLMLLGLLACGIGILAAAPLILIMFTVAYMMMTGQYYRHEPAYPQA